jgi:polysaccharide pyruvyl transferase WcaK-like protein
VPEQLPTTHGTIVLSGFFGRGNCGDEAILQAQYERLSPHFDLIISVDQYGARDGFWDWYPYDRCPTVHHGNLSCVADENVIAVHVGGGGLPYGFNAAQVIHARSHGKRAFLTGIDAKPVRTPAAAAALQSYLSLFDFVSVRSAGSHQILSELAPHCHRGADWAIALPTDGPLPVTRTNRVLIALREFPRELLSSAYCQSIANLVSQLADRYDQIALLPCCPEDERFLDWVPAVEHLPREVHWWNPRRIQREIAAASAVVSVGRLHPLIFAANVGTPAVFVEPLPGEPRWPKSNKASQLCDEHRWPGFAAVDDLLAEFDQGLPLPPLSFVSDTQARWEAMAHRVETSCRQLPCSTGGRP